VPRPRRAGPRRRPHAPRLVDVDHREALADAEDPRLELEGLDGWHVGLLTASYLRFYFPAFWAAHVAPKPITTARLLGVVHAFIELADGELLAIDTDHYCPLDLGTARADIPELVDGYRDHGGILTTLANELWSWILRPPVVTYGLSTDGLGQDWQRGEHTLCLALAWMLRHTSWQVFGLRRDQLRGLPAGDRIARLPALPPQTPMDRLADACTWSCALPGVDGPWRLGDVLRLVCSQAHNEFADYAPEEALQDMAWWCEGIYAEPGRLRYEQQKQRGARRLRAIYDALDARVRAEPRLLATLARAVLAAGEVVQTAPAGGAAPEEVVCVT
jgi:hypothetical protein